MLMKLGILLSLLLPIRGLLDSGNNYVEKGSRAFSSLNSKELQYCTNNNNYVSFINRWDYETDDSKSQSSKEPFDSFYQRNDVPYNVSSSTVSEDDLSESSEEPFNSFLQRDDVLYNSSGVSEDVLSKEGDIPSFKEWTQKALEEEEKKKKEEDDKKKLNLADNLQNSSKASKSSETSLPIRTLPKFNKNYASIDCGAKIVGSNPESQGASNVIMSSRDEYMLNKCTNKVWFVVELCESIKALRIEIANFELYSSVLKEFRVLMSNSYPSRDWAHFGTFIAKEIREIQSFSSPGVYGKYVKIEIISHHRVEHYCPISLFKMYGISEIELMAQSDDFEELDDESPSPSLEQYENNERLQSKSSSNIIVSFLKEKVDETLGKVVKVFKGSKKMENNTFFEIRNICLKNNISCFDCDERSLNEVRNILVYESFHFLNYSVYNIQNNSSSSNNNNFSSSNNNNIQQQFLEPCKNLLFGTSHLKYCPNIPKIQIYKVFFGHNYLIALCNVLENQFKDLDNESSSNYYYSSSSSSIPSESYNHGAIDDKKPETSYLSSENESYFESTIGPTPVLSTSSSVGSQIEESSTMESPNKEEPSVNILSPSSSSISLSEDSDAFQSRQRDSVWQRLTNRIKSLERNVTLSSRYLEELSVLYKKQIEDLQVSVKVSIESLSSAYKYAEEESLLRRRLQFRIDNLTNLVSNLTDRMETINIWTIGTHICFLCLEIVVGIFCILTFISMNKREVSHDKDYRFSSVLTDESIRRQSLEELENPFSHNGKRNLIPDFNDTAEVVVYSTPSRKQRKRMARRQISRLDSNFASLSDGSPETKDESFTSALKRDNNGQICKTTLRSKSTSPTRKSEAAKQREDFENFKPDSFTPDKPKWIKS